MEVEIHFTDQILMLDLMYFNKAINHFFSITILNKVSIE